MGEPSNLLLKLSRRLFAEACDRDAFVAALTQPQPCTNAVVWMQPRPANLPFAIAPPLPWQPVWVDRLVPDQRPGQHPLHQAGAYYCLDLASVFAAAVFSAIPTPVAAVLDLCAAPGGKSFLAWRALSPTHLWVNEAIRKRVKILIANLKRCGLTEALVFNLDPQVLAQQIASQVAVTVVDAPCSGQSLLAKGDQALGCFHPVNIKKNASRQKRILASAAQTVAGGGYLAYMTCTFSPEENEQVAQWLLKKFPQFKAIAVPALSDFASPLTEMPCYRLWPQSGQGAGGFTVLFHHQGDRAEPLDLGSLASQAMAIYAPRPERSPDSCLVYL
ncbi:RsmB/NOP family class I SAM-dependent RNA methyltransferase [Nodosilinea sp. LEGE 07088]|uniref:RsmB/NOP family class I SAM-dependent RNA methyltransferase n=1 Tax=Nodosilinea sp. LEGE 07088 TaxID=2777968 RepID=UPI00187EA2B6|nr:RsmB/NOP family class I SAM-dependent RNA methyltransferase [Nodosilinea sp. LEGE 07088]MBE9138278.1 RsmB/NOP family class I SAM-dependent RNA methyltransferase [Nodosilinea sp. LEGE 07088]